MVIRWEPFTICFDDLVDKCERRYTPDYLVETIATSGSRYTYIIEVKPEAEVDRIWRHDPYGLDARRHVAMMAWCNGQRATEFVLVSERVLEEKGLPNMIAVLDRATYAVDDDIKAALLDGKNNPTRSTLGSLLDRALVLGLQRGPALSSILRLCADDELWFDLASPVTDETVFARGPRRRVFRR